MIDPETPSKHQFDSESLTRLEALVEAKAPPIVGFSTSLSPGAALLMGYIIAQWGMLQDSIEFQIAIFGQDPKIPVEIRAKPIRKEARHRIGYLREAMPYVLEGRRAGAVVLYLQNLSRILRCKGVRDALAHGSFSANDNNGFSGLVVQYKGRKLHLTMDALQRVAQQIGECHGFLLSFWSWVDAERNRDSLEAYLRTLVEQGGQKTSP